MAVATVGEHLFDVDKIRAQHEEQERQLNSEFEEASRKVQRLQKLYEDCRVLWTAGKFLELSQSLGREGFHYFRELKEELNRATSNYDRLQSHLDVARKNLVEGIVCPKCDGVRTVVADKHYERSGGQVIPIVKMQECDLCKGSGKLSLRK